MKLVLLHKTSKLILFCFVALLAKLPSFAQVAGDFRSNAATFNWSAAASWQQFNGTSWVAAAVYPGQNTGAGTVTILNGHTVTLNAVVPNAIGSLVVGITGTGNAQLNMNTNAATALIVTGNVNVDDGNINAVNVGGSRTCTFSIGGNLDVATGNIFDLVSPDGTDVVNAVFNGTSNQTVSGGTTTYDFNYIRINNTGAANNNIVEFNSTITARDGFFTTANGGIGSGIFKLSAPASLIAATGNLSIPTNGGIHLNNAAAQLSVGTVTGALTVNGALTVDNGILNVGIGLANNITINNTAATVNFHGGTININGRLVMMDGTINIDGSTVNLDAQGPGGATAATQSIFDARGTVNLSFTAGIVTIIDPHAATGTANAVQLLTGTGLKNLLGGTIQLGDGISTTPGSADGFDIRASFPIGNLIINNPSGTNRHARLITNDCTVQGNLLISAGNLNLNGLDLFVGGNWTNSGTFTQGAGLVTFNAATGNQTITNATGETFATLRINKATSGNVVLANNVTVTGALTLSNGGFSIASNTLTLNGAVSRTNGNFVGSNTSNLVISGTAGSLYFEQTAPNNFLRTLTINNAASATLGNLVNITAFDGTSEGVLTVNGTGSLNANGFLTIKSSALGTARIAAGNAAGGYLSGNVTVERFIPQNPSKAWRLLASNTNGQTINQAWQENQIGFNSNTQLGFGTMIPGKAASLAAAQAIGFDTLSAGASIYGYIESTDALFAIPNTNTTQLNSQEGYFIYIRGDRSANQFGSSTVATTSTTLRSKGSVFQGNQPVKTVLASQYALLRNPFASAIDLRNITIGGGLVDAYQVWDPRLAGSYGLGGYQTLTRYLDHYHISPGGGSFGTDSVVNTIESGAAFFVQATGASGTIQITESCKVGGSRVVFRPATVLTSQGKISTSLYYMNSGNAVLADGNMVLFGDTYSNNFNKEDVKKSSNFGENFGMMKEGFDLAVEKRQLPVAEDSVVFSMRKLKLTTYQLRIKSDNVSLPGMYATLEDKFTGTSLPINLTGTTQYDFTVTSNTLSSASNRFTIAFRPLVVLPVTFTNIKAAQVSDDINVEWKVINQAGIAKYEVEKSTNGKSFTAVGTQAAAQNNSAELTYNWLDKNASQGANYYRIKSTDLNGKSNYTSIAKVIINQKGSGIAVYPNPIRANEKLVIQLMNQPAGTYQVRIINPVGQEIAKQTLQHGGGSASQSINTPNGLSKGLYQIQVISKDKMIDIQKLIVDNE